MDWHFFVKRTVHDCLYDNPDTTIIIYFTTFNGISSSSKTILAYLNNNQIEKK
jgi:hypothetical protein